MVCTLPSTLALRKAMSITPNRSVLSNVSDQILALVSTQDPQLSRGISVSELLQVCCTLSNNFQPVNGKLVALISNWLLAKPTGFDPGPNAVSVNSLSGGDIANFLHLGLLVAGGSSVTHKAIRAVFACHHSKLDLSTHLNFLKFFKAAEAVSYFPTT